MNPLSYKWQIEPYQSLRNQPTELLRLITNNLNTNKFCICAEMKKKIN